MSRRLLSRRLLSCRQELGRLQHQLVYDGSRTVTALDPVHKRLLTRQT